MTYPHFGKGFDSIIKTPLVEELKIMGNSISPLSILNTYRP